MLLHLVYQFFRYPTPTCPCQISLKLLLEHRAIKFVWNIVHESDLLIVIHFFAFFWSETIEFACDPSVQITSHEHYIPNHSSYNNGSHLTMAFLHSHSLAHTFIQKNTAFPYICIVFEVFLPYRNVLAFNIEVFSTVLPLNLLFDWILFPIQIISILQLVIIIWI